MSEPEIIASMLTGAAAVLVGAWGLVMFRQLCRDVAAIERHLRHLPKGETTWPHDR